LKNAKLFFRHFFEVRGETVLTDCQTAALSDGAICQVWKSDL